jgi:hypothetical protein
VEEESMQFRVNVTRGFLGLWFTLRYQIDLDGKWWTIDTYRTRSLKKKPREAEVWVWGFFIRTGVLTTPKCYESLA